MKAEKLPRLSVEEYIQYEIETGQRHEYHDGLIYALAGGTIEHALIIGNVYSELRNSLRKKGSNCKPITNDAKLHIKKENKFVYPDTMVICGEFDRSNASKDAVTNPILIVEVLSKSTSGYDRGDKFYFYRQIPSLQEYILIDQSRYLVEIYYKKEKSDLWRITRSEGIDQQIKLQSLNIVLSMKDLYYDVEINKNID